MVEQDEADGVMTEGEAIAMELAMQSAADGAPPADLHEATPDQQLEQEQEQEQEEDDQEVPVTGEDDEADTPDDETPVAAASSNASLQPEMSFSSTVSYDDGADADAAGGGLGGGYSLVSEQAGFTSSVITEDSATSIGGVWRPT